MVTLAKTSLVVICQFHVLKFIVQNKQTVGKKKTTLWPYVWFLLTLYFESVTFATCDLTSNNSVETLLLIPGS